jgi:hypothetical protein
MTEPPHLGQLLAKINTPEGATPAASGL